MLRALRGVLLVPRLFGLLLRVLDPFLVLQFDALAIERVGLALRIFRRHRVAVMALAVLINPHEFRRALGVVGGDWQRQPQRAASAQAPEQDSQLLHYAPPPLPDTGLSTTLTYPQELSRQYRIPAGNRAWRRAVRRSAPARRHRFPGH